MFILLCSVMFCFACFASQTSGLCSAFPFGSPQVYTLVLFFVLFSLLLLCVLCPASSGLCSDFCPAPLEYARLVFCFVLFSFNFVFSVLSLTNLIFLRFPIKLAHRFCNLVRVFRHAASSSASLLPFFPSSFVLFFNLCVPFVPRLFCAVISYVFLPALPW